MCVSSPTNIFTSALEHSPLVAKICIRNGRYWNHFRRNPINFLYLRIATICPDSTWEFYPAVNVCGPFLFQDPHSCQLCSECWFEQIFVLLKFTSISPDSNPVLGSEFFTCMPLLSAPELSHLWHVHHSYGSRESESSKFWALWEPPSCCKYVPELTHSYSIKRKLQPKLEGSSCAQALVNTKLWPDSRKTPSVRRVHISWHSTLTHCTNSDRIVKYTPLCPG